MTAYDRLVDKLRDDGRKVTERAGKTSAQCPAHEDRDPSLSLTKIEGQVLVHCHAGCQTEDVATALGLTMRDLYDEPTGATYRYTDPTGTVLRTVSRTPDKKFRQSGQTKGPSTLYRLPQVIEAIANGVTVYVVEGEKDVHALESIGVVATTAPMGADNWSKVDSTPLHGGDVVVVVDSDDAGQKPTRPRPDGMRKPAPGTRTAGSTASHSLSGTASHAAARPSPPRRTTSE